MPRELLDQWAATTLPPTQGTVGGLADSLEKLIAKRSAAPAGVWPPVSAVQRALYCHCGETGEAAGDMCWLVAQRVVWEERDARDSGADADPRAMAERLLVQLALARLEG
jgi:hypothetical protein